MTTHRTLAAHPFRRALSPAVVALVATVAVVATFGGATGCGNTSTELLCEPACPAGTHCTESGCVSDDPNKVVDLAVVAGPDLAGACNPACGGATPYCQGGRCVVCLTDDHCPAGQVCKTSGLISVCVSGCNDDARCGGAGKKCCGGQCLDTTKDPQNCGACGNACGSQHSRATCAAGVCVPGACNAGWGDCNMNAADGCETNVRIDPKNCGACGATCKFPNAVAGCSNTCFIAACTFGYDDCNGDEKDGCEVSVLADAKNCGACGQACAARANATVKCLNAGCALTSCNLGFADCDGNAVNGCEIVVTTDARNCGACGNACPQGQVCKNGGCTCGNCNIANAKTKCINNVCTFDGCQVGFADCNNDLNDGCEVNLTTDSKNCNGCGMACPAMQTCAGGACMKCGNDCWGPSGCLTGQGKCIQFTCRAGNSGATFCNGCKGWKDVTYDQWMNQGYCADVIARYRMSDGNTTHCGNAGACCGSSQACAGGDNAWHFWNTQDKQNYYTGPSLGTPNDVNCKFWNNTDNSGYTRITVCEQ